MAEPDAPRPMHVALIGAVGAVALALTWVLAITARPRWTIVVAATMASVTLALAAVAAYRATVRGVDEQRRRERQLSHRASHDELTGVANRGLFLGRVDDVVLADAPSAALLFVDVDDLKLINDELGHASGDAVLRTVAERISAWVRPTDTVGRLGGDEFAVLLTDVDALTARHVGEQIAEAVAGPIDLEGRRLRPGVSIGVAPARPGVTTSALLADADAAMYRAKRAGKGRVHLFDPALGSAVTTSISADLRGAADRGELRLVYLPEVDLHTGMTLGVEALVRWQHHQRGVLRAAEFLDEAERSGDIESIGWWAIERAVADAARWSRHRRVSINLAATQLDARDIVRRIAGLLERRDVDASLITFEVPESALTGSSVRERALSGLRRLGCGLAVDGFTASECPLQRIIDLDATTIKLASSLSTEIESDERTQALVRSIVAWADTAAIATVAVAVERTAQLEIFRDLGCHSGQGHILATALEASDVAVGVGPGAEL